MCLITINSEKTTIGDKQIADFYTHNPDGLGIMRYEQDKVHIHKFLPKTAKEAIRLYKKYANGDCIVHWRMATHGKVDIANAHPYQVTPNLWMMHNGVIHHAARDIDKMSDTWHFIRDVLRPILTDREELLQSRAIHKLIQDHVDSNRLVFMDSRGVITVINESKFIDAFGAKLSNTYAWSYPITPKIFYKNDYLYGNTYAIDYDNRLTKSNKLDETDEMESENQGLIDLCLYYPEEIAAMLADYGITEKDCLDYCGLNI